MDILQEIVLMKKLKNLFGNVIIVKDNSLVVLDVWFMKKNVLKNQLAIDVEEIHIMQMNVMLLLIRKVINCNKKNGIYTENNFFKEKKRNATFIS
jgi:hypothetical protein